MNNKVFFTVVFAMIVFASLTTVGFAAGHESPTKVLTLNPISTLVGIISGEYEIETSPGSTLGIQGMYWNYNLNWDAQLNAIGGAVGFRNYILGRTFDGPYYGAYGGIATGSGRYYDSWTGWESATASILSITGVAGFKWLWDNGFVSDIGVSVGLPVIANISDGNLSQSDVAVLMGMTTGFSVSLGYAW